MNSRYIFLLIFFALMLPTVNQVFAATEHFLVPPNEQKTFSLTINENQKVFFQIFVDGGDDDIYLKIIDDTGVGYYNSIIRQEKQNINDGASTFPAYKNEITNYDQNTKTLTFTFDNSRSTATNKNIDFTYIVFETNGSNFEQTQLGSWIFTFVIVVLVIASIIAAIVIIIKTLKKKNS